MDAAPAASPVRLLPNEVAGVATVAKFFRALGDATRLRLLEFLLDEEHTVISAALRAAGTCRCGGRGALRSTGSPIPGSPSLSASRVGLPRTTAPP